MSAKHGSGATTVAVNLAGIIAARSGQRTALIDLDRPLGDAAAYLNVKPNFTVSDALAAGPRLDSVLLESYMGVLYLQAQKLGDAQQYFQKALQLEPDYEVARVNLSKLEALIPQPAIVQLPAFSNEAVAVPQPGDVHLAAEPQAPAESKAPNFSRDEAGTSARNWPNGHLTGVK